MTVAALRFLPVLLAALVLCGCTPPLRPDDAQAPLPVVPRPVVAERGSGSFDLADDVAIGATAGDEPALAVARQFAGLVERTYGRRLRVTDAAHARVTFEIDPKFTVGAADLDEGYALEATPRRVALRARTAHGLFDASMTLWQLLEPAASGGGLRIPAVRISDYPRFAWRGLLLDSARHFQPPEFVKRFIDEMAVHKLDVLHWHLTDDQGWRIEIRRYPLLTRLGAWRVPQPNEAALVDPSSGKYGGYYTQEQIRDIVRYAAARHVTIVPEIDMPGHAQAAIAAYPRIGVTGARPPVSADWGINTWLYGVDEPTFEFIGNVLDEVLDLFPSPYIHVGGDEAAKDQWRASAAVQARMRALGIQNEAALQGYFTARLGAYLTAHGRRLVGWDEILETGLPPGAVVMSWRGSEGAVAAAQHGDDAVLSPSPTLYFDHLQSRAQQEPPGRIDVISLADVYAFDPLPRELDAAAARHVLGAQANLWSEYLTTPARVEHAAFPRAAALAERLWSPAGSADWSGFLARLPALFARYRALGIHYSDTAVVPQVAVAPGAAQGEYVTTIAQQAAVGTLRYTLDGRAPAADSPAYAGPIVARAPQHLQAATFAGAGQLSSLVGQPIDATAAWRRYSDRLRSCGKGLLLRLEGGPGALGRMPLYNVDLMNPCWIYPQVDFDARRALDVRVGRLPYFFQLWNDTEKVVRHAPVGGAASELQLHADSCDGRLLASVALADRAEQTLRVALPDLHGVRDICAFFADRSRERLWLVDWIEPVAGGE